ncbi:hypothetical protein Poly30_38200 [Planctomycetes bacterium Poly30]|uniref:Tetratricopeptide repeat protein n=1 Tax=Saltatorellus ferox TaxID=2528018 RepID=A0A518EW15_9BACT|nr:hypothetical protein Poly30_38200 [Planctomycetes bacterium Poly30]
MTILSTFSIDSVLSPSGDSFDSDREGLRDALSTGDPTARKQVFDFANRYWATVATEAWNEGERSSEIMEICLDVKRLCEWVYETSREESEERYDTGGAVTTSGMMLYVLGDTDGAIERFREIIRRPVNSYFHESTFEKLISVLIKDDRADEAMVEVEQLLESYPHNDFGARVKEAYAHEMGSGGSAGGGGTKIDAETYGKVTTALSEQFSRDIETLSAQGLPPAELQVRMGDAQKAFQSAMELLSRLL